MSTLKSQITLTAGRVIVLAGPSGCGKTEVGRALAELIGATFLDADDFHTPEAKALMHAGHPLSDDERHPWLERVRSAAVAASAQSVVVLACSALKVELRHFLSTGPAQWTFIALHVEPELLRKRVSKRAGHFFPAKLLDSQLADWQPLGPEEGFSVDGSQAVDAVAMEIQRRLLGS